MVDHENILTRKFFARNFLTRKFPELRYSAIVMSCESKQDTYCSKAICYRIRCKISYALIHSAITVVWVFFVCTNFSGINIQGKIFSRSRVITKIKRTKIKWRKYYFDVERLTWMELEEFRVVVRVRGQHIYKDIWYAVVGKVLVCERDPNNFQDRYAGAV